ncbi:MAG: hypothetical protein ACP5PS_09695, partial [Bacteroidales bacterium]
MGKINDFKNKKRVFFATLQHFLVVSSLTTKVKPTQKFINMKRAWFVNTNKHVEISCDIHPILKINSFGMKKSVLIFIFSLFLAVGSYAQKFAYIDTEYILN